MVSDRRGQPAAKPAVVDRGAERVVNPCRRDPARDRPGSRFASVERGERWTLAALFLATLVLRVVVLWRFRVNSDEPQHLHVVWAWTQGLLPYRDVFDNHMPLFHVLSIPAFLALGERPDAVLWMRLVETRYVLVTANGTPPGLLDDQPYDGPRILAPGLHSYRALDDDEHIALLWEAAAAKTFSPFDRAGGWR
jgi:hypothetical protein